MDRIGMRKNTIQIAATGKENLTTKTIPKKKAMNKTKLADVKKPKNSTIIKESKNVVAVKNNINKIKTEVGNDNVKKTVTTEDLTSSEPSENFYQKLAETRRRALEVALKENVDLHNKVNELEYENDRLKEMLNEAKSLIEVLTEMAEKNETSEAAGDEISENKDDSDNTDDSDSEADVSFRSCA